MHVFKYKGYDDDGNRVEGQIEAATLDEAERRVASQSVSLIAIIPAGMRKGTEVPKVSPEGQAPSRRKIPEADAAGILRNLSVMAETGVPFIEALDAIIQSARTPRIASAMAQVRQEVIGGKALLAAFRTVPNLFPPLVCDLIHVAEDGGRLDQALLSGAVYLERGTELRKRVLQAMINPFVMLGVATITITVLIVFVLPKFRDVFRNMNADIPFTTQFMIDMGTAVSKNPLQSLSFLMGCIMATGVALRFKIVRAALMRLVWSLPAVGDLMKQLALSRAFQSIATLLNGNVPLMVALDHGSKVAGHDWVRDGLQEARDCVEHGGALSEGLLKSSVFPKSLIQMVSVGERTGRLSSLLAVVAGKMEHDSDAKLKSVVAILEPLLIVVMGVIVGSITVSIISPIYSVIEKVK